MKLIPIFIAIAIPVAASAATITGFGTGDFAVSFTDFSTANQVATTISLTGNDQNTFSGSIAPFAFGLDFPATISLTATVTTNPASSFQVLLVDENFNFLTYTGNWSSFSPSPSIVLLDFSGVTGAFNGTVSNISFLTGGTGAGLAITLDQLETSPIPEPATYAAISGLLALGAIGFRRRRH